MQARSIITSILLSLLSILTVRGTDLAARTYDKTESYVPILVEIPAGHFYMGSNGEGENFDEAPVHGVSLSAFRMSQCEITNAQYECFRPEHCKHRGEQGLSTEDDDAVVNVSYDDALAYCEWLSKREGRHFRLPTEAEWEYACRAGTYTRYYFGDGLPASCCRNQIIARNFEPVSLRVGISPANAFGLFDMHGNVEEWCLDWYGTYTANEVVNPKGPELGEFRVTRGGSHHTPTTFLRSANRSAMIPEDKNCQVGFRIVEEIDSPQPTIPSEQIAESLGVGTFDAPRPFVIRPTNDTPFYRHNHQPAVTWCKDGSLLAIWFSADAENGREMVVLSSRLTHPEDPNCQWTPAELFYKVPDRNMTGSALFTDKTGKIYHFNGVESSGDWQNLAMILRTSDDNGKTWMPSRLIAPSHSMRHQVIQGTIQTREGYLIQLCDAGPESHDGAAIHISRDGGQTWHDPHEGERAETWRAAWPEIAKAGKGIGPNIAGIHAGIVQLADGSLLALGRGNAIMNAEGKRRMPLSRSTDWGETWQYEPSVFPPIDGGQRLVLMRLQEGPILLVSFTDHPQRTPESERGMDFEQPDGSTIHGYGTYCALSYDEGKTWPVRRLLTDGQDRHLDGGAWTGFFDMDASHAEPRGYLAGTQSPDGKIHILSSRLHYCFDLEWLEHFSTRKEKSEATN